MTELLFPEIKEDLDKLKLEGMLFEIPDLRKDVQEGMNCCADCRNSYKCGTYTFIRELEKSDKVKLIVIDCRRELYESRRI